MQKVSGQSSTDKASQRVVTFAISQSCVKGFILSLPEAEVG